MKVLAIFSNPRGTSALRLGEEDSTIRECIRRGRNRDNVELVVRHAATVDDVRRALLDDNFSIVHFSGHGTTTGLAFEDRAGALYIPPRQAISELLAEYSPPLECVLLNACYSVYQGEFTSMEVPFTIAMERPISDSAAISFAGAFYDSIAAGKDIEFSYRQGVHALKLEAHPDSSVPLLLRKGERYKQPSRAEDPPASTRSGEESTRSARALIGVGIDVSGSMETSMGNYGTGESRLESVQNAITAMVQQYSASVQQLGTSSVPVWFFGYAFGLRDGSICDLFSLLRHANELVRPGEIDELKRQYTAEVSARYTSSNFGGLASLARQYGLGSYVDAAAGGMRAQAEAEVRERVVGELTRRVLHRLRQVGETTLQLNELIDLCKGSKASFDNAKEFIFGNTPMCAVLKEIKSRFHKELNELDHSGDVTPLLLLVSDGDPTDGNPEPYAEAILATGVTIVSCFLTAIDIAEPRRLVASPAPHWPEGAKRLFRMSSHVGDNSPISQYLMRNGWTVEQDARCFVQANHSELLREFIGIAGSVSSDQRVTLPKGD